MESTGSPSYVTDFGDSLTDGDYTAEIYLQTLNPIHDIEFEWIIHNFSRLPDDIYSEEFSLLETCSTKWKCALISSTSRKNTKDLDLELLKTDKNPAKIRVGSQFIMANTEGKVIGETETNVVLSYFSDNFIVLSAPHPLKSVKKKHRVDLPGDKLVIYGKLKVCNCCITTAQTPLKASLNFIVRPIEGVYKCVIESIGGDS